MASEFMDREINEFVGRTPKSRELQEQAKQYLPGGSSRGTAYFDPYPAFIDYGEGHYMYDVDGNRYLDFMINATSLVMGHANPKVVEALQKQAAKGTAYSGPTEAQIKLAEILCERIPSVDTIRFGNSGTEGTMMAVRAARAFTGRHKIAKFEGGYHGSHEYVAISVKPSMDKLSVEGTDPIAEHPGQPPKVLEDVVVLPYNDLETSEQILKLHKDNLACVLMEPIASAFGYLPATQNFISGIRKITNELDILLIFDEVQSFRVSPGGAQEMMGVTPDLTTLGKIIGGGMPAGAFGGRADVMALYDPAGGSAPIAHAGTFNANPMTMLAGAITLESLTPEIYSRLNGLGNILREKLRAVMDELEVSAQVTGVGSLWGVHFTSEDITDYRSVARADQSKTKALFLGLVNEGVMTNSNGGGALNILTTEAEVDELVDATRRVIERIR